MTSLTSAPIAPLLERLFAEADATEPSTTPSVAEYWKGLSGEDKARIVRSRTDYLDFYARMKDVPLAVSRETGNLLYMLARAARDLPESVDLLLLDGAKALYPDILDLVESRLRPGALVVADNADFCPAYLERVRSEDGGYRSVPFGEDLELSMRLG